LADLTKTAISKQKVVTDADNSGFTALKDICYKTKTVGAITGVSDKEVTYTATTGTITLTKAVNFANVVGTYFLIL
jgi:ethanolamine utilization microcompartment shell protein EutL